MPEFTCGLCNTVYETHSTKQEKEAEFFAEYNEHLEECAEDVVSLCDVCYAYFQTLKFVSLEKPHDEES